MNFKKGQLYWGVKIFEGQVGMSKKMKNQQAYDFNHEEWEI